MKAIKLFTIISALLISAQAQANIFNTAQDRTEIMLDETHHKGQNLIPIRARINKKLKAQGLSVQDFKLVGITLRAKSKNGNGKATLIVGGDSETRNVRGPKSAFGGFGGDLGNFFGEIGWLDKGGNTFRRIEWNLAGQPGVASEKWQIRFNGNIKVDFMEVHLESALTKVRITLNDQIYGTAGNAISDKVRIRQSLKAAGYLPGQYKLRAVRVRGKSKQGGGKVTLVTKNKTYATKGLLKAPQGNFKSTAPKSYNTVAWKNVSASNGKWVLQLTGRNRLKAVVVVLEAK